LEKWKFDAKMSVPKWWCLRDQCFFLSENSLFSDWLRETTKTYEGKNVSFGTDSQDSDGFWPSIPHHEESQWSAVAHFIDQLTLGFW